MRRNPSIAAVHEAGHAVASVAFGLSFRGVRVYRRKRGEGMHYGTGRTLNLLHLSNDGLWGRAIVLLAGGMAEAKRRRHGASYVFFTTAAGDYRHFEQHRTALALRLIPDFMRAADIQSLDAEALEECAILAAGLAESLARDFVRERWPEILKVAAKLDAEGFLSASQVRAIVEAA